MELRDSLIHNPAFIYLYTEHLKGAVNHVLLPDVIPLIVDFVFGVQSVPTVVLFGGCTIDGVFSSRRKAEGFLNRVPEVYRDLYQDHLDDCVDTAPDTPRTYFKELLDEQFTLVEAPDININEPIYVLMDGNRVKGNPRNYLTNSLKKFTEWQPRKDDDLEWIKRCTFRVNVPKHGSEEITEIS
jgi:hypothetical protein